MTPEQLRMARSALKLSVRKLGEMSGVSFVSISRFENEKSGLQLSSASAIRGALEARGVTFLNHDDASNGIGVSLCSN